MQMVVGCQDYDFRELEKVIEHTREKEKRLNSSSKDTGKFF